MADLLLGVFCMPFTLVGQVLRNFIFGAVMCKLIPYFQGKFYVLTCQIYLLLNTHLVGQYVFHQPLL